MELLERVRYYKFTEAKYENYSKELDDLIIEFDYNKIIKNKYCEKLGREWGECVKRVNHLSTRIGNLESQKRNKNNRVSHEHLDENIAIDEKQREIYLDYQLALDITIGRLKEMIAEAEVQAEMQDAPEPKDDKKMKMEKKELQEIKLINGDDWLIGESLKEVAKEIKKILPDGRQLTKAILESYGIKKKTEWSGMIKL